jgi:general stress protein 26
MDTPSVGFGMKGVLMDDTKRRVLATLQRDGPFLCFLATLAEDSRPWVRAMRGVIDDKLIIRCPTFAGTRKVDHIRAESEVHLMCGDTDPSSPGSYFQIEARAEIVQETADRRLAWSERLEKWFSGIDDPAYAVVRITPYRIQALPIGGGPPPSVWEA